MSQDVVRILFVCMGNICRSPTAEGVARATIERAGLSRCFELDSAGTHAYHVGEAPDRRAQKAAQARGYDLSRLRARQVKTADFLRFDRILAMDRDNLALLKQACPPDQQHRLGLFLEYGSDPGVREVPDPYYGGADGFEYVLELVEDASRGLIEAFRPQK